METTNIRRSIAYEGFDNDRWVMSIDFAGNVQVICNGEGREYKIHEPITKIEHDTEYVYLYVQDPEKQFYQFKFEVEAFLVADIFNKDDEHLDTFASHVFGEDC
jgi:hypothetical protein